MFMREIPLKFMMIVFIACFLLVVLPVTAVKMAEQSVGDSLTRGSRFTVTITGIPNSSYYIWIPHTSSMTGEPRDQPPVIADSQTNVAEDPDDGPWPIGSYQYNNGNGQTIRDDIPPINTCSAEFPVLCPGNHRQQGVGNRRIPDLRQYRPEIVLNQGGKSPVHRQRYPAGGTPGLFPESTGGDRDSHNAADGSDHNPPCNDRESANSYHPSGDHNPGTCQNLPPVTNTNTESSRGHRDRSPRRRTGAFLVQKNLIFFGIGSSRF